MRAGSTFITYCCISIPLVINIKVNINYNLKAFLLQGRILHKWFIRLSSIDNKGVQKWAFSGKFSGKKPRAKPKRMRKSRLKLPFWILKNGLRKKPPRSGTDLTKR